MKKSSFIARMPDAPGSLHKAAAIIKNHGANINRIQFDRRIDPTTVFYEVSGPEESLRMIADDLSEIGYLQTSLKPQSFLKCAVYLPHRPGALHEFLNYTTSAGANIASIDFDDTSRHPDRLTVSLNLEQTSVIDDLMDLLKSRYRIEILEYDTTGKHLDDTVFYVKYAQAVRDVIGGSEDTFLQSFLADTNHIVQELMDRGHDPGKVFDSILRTGRTMKMTTGGKFYADLQKFGIGRDSTLYCFQMPCGGNIFLIESGGERVMIDTGYGIYRHDVASLLGTFGLQDGTAVSRIIVTHADADHCGAAGYYNVPVYLHRDTLSIIRQNNRAYGSRRENSVLEEFYTKMINLFSQFSSPDRICCFPGPNGTVRGIFPVIDTITIGSLTFEVLEGLGGHTRGQVYLLSQDAGLLFTADSVINFSSLTRERADFSSLAAFLVTSVNVDSDLAKTERAALLDLARVYDEQSRQRGSRLLICGGHGAVSILEENRLAAIGDSIHYGYSGT